MRLICVHGIGQQRSGEREILQSWVPAIQDGLERAGAAGIIDDAEIGMAFYGAMFRPGGRRLDISDPPNKASDVQPGLEQDLLLAWWRAAADVDDAVVPPDAATLARTPKSAQAALRALSRSRFFSGLALRALVADLKQVRMYLTDAGVRERARNSVRTLISPDTQVVIGHSLGSVVAYESLCALNERSHALSTFITLGSPLGIRNLIFERLIPSPDPNGRGQWPGESDMRWTNVADAGDVVALVKDLRPRFGERVACFEVDNGASAHDARPYLNDAVTGTAIASGLLT